jgi:hypothetical protein
MKRQLVLAIVGIILLTGCYYDVEEDLYGTCNTNNVTYSTTISGILNSYGCITCHTGPNPSGGFTLTSYAGVKAKINDGRLYGAINHLNGFAPMPQGAPKMTQCDLNKAKAWIDAGAPDN